jgi:hypothetical protein
MGRPQSWTATTCSTLTWPVSVSTATLANCTPPVAPAICLPPGAVYSSRRRARPATSSVCIFDAAARKLIALDGLSFGKTFPSAITSSSAGAPSAGAISWSSCCFAL